jgi:hypothetical protein
MSKWLVQQNKKQTCFSGKIPKGPFAADGEVFIRCASRLLNDETLSMLSDCAIPCGMVFLYWLVTPNSL